MDAESLNMRIGLGATRWAKGIETSSLDGIGHYTHELCVHLQRLHEQLKIIPVVFGSTHLEELDGASIARVPPYSASALWSVGSGSSFPRSNSLKKSIDIFHATDHFTPKLTGIPVVATLMDAIPMAHPQWASQRARALKNWLWRKSARWADHVITISDYSKHEIMHWFDLPEQKISVIPLGVDARYFHRLDQHVTDHPTNLPDIPERFFLFVGTLQPRKNIERIIDAHQKLPASIRKDIPLLLVGQPGFKSSTIIQRLGTYGTNAEVRWLRYVDDHCKRILMQRSTAMVFPSLSEGFGLPVLEAFASQTPVITSNTSSLPEVAGDAAWLVNPLDVDAIAEAMMTIAQEESVRQKLISKGLERAQTFSWERCSAQTVEVYAHTLKHC